jgi:hypothetical protein
MKRTLFAVAACAAAFSTMLIAAPVQAQSYVKGDEHPLPRLVQKDGRFALLVDNEPFLMLSAEDLMLGVESTWPPRATVWQAMDFMHVNTVEIAVYWNDFEPRPGEYNYEGIDRLLTEARQHHVRLVPLWFGTYKNGSQHYTPDWMKLEPDRYTHALNRNGEAVDSPSPFCSATLEADEHAFAALMRHLKEVDSQRTVIMVQVENETGDWGSVRDFSPAAQKFFDAPVPPEVLKAMPPKTNSPSPTWSAAYGPDADEYFNAWSVARYVGQVAAAGKAVYPLPMDANAAVRDPLHPGPANTYESGGPTDNVLNIWKAAAPAIDVLGPDDYDNDPAGYVKLLELYHRSDNPLFLPETSGPCADRFFFTALGLQAIGVSAASDSTQSYLLGPQDATVDTWVGTKFTDGFVTSWAMNYRLIGPMQREIARLNFEGKLQAVAEEQGKVSQTLPFKSWDAVVSYGTYHGSPPTGNPKPTGRALVAQLDENTFLVAGYSCHVDFRPSGTDEQRKSGQIVIGAGQNPSALIDGKWRHRQFVRIEEGVYENGVFRLIRNWNGGEIDWGVSFHELPMVMRISLATY